MRLVKGYTQKELGKRIGEELRRPPLTEGAVRSWEKKGVMPGMAVALATARALGTTLDFLVSEGGEPLDQQEKKMLMEIHERMKELDELKNIKRRLQALEGKKDSKEQK